MVTAELWKQRTFRLRDLPTADPGPGEVQVAVNGVGICGSDLHNFMEGGIGDMEAQYPMVLGHEPVGEVLRTGHAVTGWQKGDRAALEPALYCYHCEYCMTGRHNVCARIRFLSSGDDPGFFREVVNLPVTNVFPLPPEVDLAAGTLHEPLAVALHSLALAKPELGETALVTGAGPIGLLTIIALKLAGVRTVYAVEPVAHRRELAKLAGAVAAIDPGQCDPAREVFTATGGRGVDLAIDCVAKEDSLDCCIAATRNAGRIAITGIPSEVRVPLAFHTLRRRETSLFFVRRSNRESETALRLLAEEPRLFAPIVTHVLPLDQIQSAFEMLETQTGGPGKVVLTPA